MLVTSIFSFSHHVFYPLQINFIYSAINILSSANAFNLDWSKILLLQSLCISLTLNQNNKIMITDSFILVDSVSIHSATDPGLFGWYLFVLMIYSQSILIGNLSFSLREILTTCILITNMPSFLFFYF